MTTIPTGTKVRITTGLLTGRTGRVFIADSGDGATVVMLAASGVRASVATVELAIVEAGPFAVEVTPRVGRTFHVAAETIEDAMAEADAQCAAPNRVYVAILGAAGIVWSRDLWAERQAGKEAA